MYLNQGNENYKFPQSYMTKALFMFIMTLIKDKSPVIRDLSPAPYWQDQMFPIGIKQPDL